MSSLIFHELPPGPTPLFLGETRERVAEVGRLILDHAIGRVYFEPNDPYETCIIPGHSRQRFAVWEIEALTPRRQLVALYEDAKPLLERLQTGTTLVRGEDRWIRTRTLEADAADLVIGDMTAEPAIAPVEWLAAPRLLIGQETALQRALRNSGRIDAVTALTVADGEFSFGEYYSKIQRHISVTVDHKAAISILKEAGKNVDADANHGTLAEFSLRGSADIIISPRGAAQVKGASILFAKQLQSAKAPGGCGISGQWARLFE